MNAADELFDWLVDGAPGAKQSIDIVERVARDLVSHGVPLERFFVFVTTLHPTVLGRQFRWAKNEEMKTLELTYEIQESPAFKNSPIVSVVETRNEVRRRLDAPLDDADFGILHDLRDEGCTDYLCAPLSFVGGETHAVTFITRAHGGFSDEHIATIHRILRPLARLAEIFALHRVASNLLSTYVGHDTGERILSGRIMKGDVEVVRAVIWFSDLRGFTEMSSRLTPREIIDTLNELFECQVPAIEKRGGEVLKFIGDGLLAIFPVKSDADVRARCEDALSASRDAFDALDARNTLSRRRPSPTPLLQFGLALHVGEFAYGNIGGASRFDFTAIGPAVNIAARLEGLTGKLGKRVVVSEDFREERGPRLRRARRFRAEGRPGKSGRLRSALVDEHGAHYACKSHSRGSCARTSAFSSMSSVFFPHSSLSFVGLPHREVTRRRAGRDGRVEADVEEAHLARALLRGVDHALHEIALHAAIERAVVILVRTPHDVERRLAVGVDARLLERRVRDAIDHRRVERHELGLREILRELDSPRESAVRRRGRFCGAPRTRRAAPSAPNSSSHALRISMSAMACIVPHCQSVAGSKSVFASTSSRSRFRPFAYGWLNSKRLPLRLRRDAPNAPCTKSYSEVAGRALDFHFQFFASHSRSTKMVLTHVPPRTS